MWVIVALASLTAVIILILSLPLSVVLHFNTSDKPKLQIRLVWLLGLVSKKITRGKKKPEAEKKALKGKRKPKKSKLKAATIFKILRTRGLPGQLKRLLGGILRCAEARDLRANFKIGLGDPADTGFLLALIWPAIFFLGSSRFDEIKIQPSFEDEAAFEGYLHGAARLIPIRLVVPLLRFTFSLAALRVIKILILAKWKRKK